MADDLGKNLGPTPPSPGGAAPSSATEPVTSRPGQPGASGARKGIFDNDAVSRQLERENPALDRDDDAELSEDDAAAIAAATGADEREAGEQQNEAPADESTAPADKPAKKPTKAEKKAADDAAAAKTAAKPAEPAKPTVLAADAPVRLADDIPEYTAGQIAQAVRQYPELLEKANRHDAVAAENASLKGIFRGGDLDAWKHLVDKVTDNKAFSDYINEAIKTYNEWEAEQPGGAPAQQQAQRLPQAPSETDRKLVQIEAWQRQQEQREAVAAVQRDTQNLRAADPRLDDEDVWRMVVDNAILQHKNGRGDYTLVHSARDMEARIARMTAQPPAHVAARQNVPALVTGSGAAPRANSQEIDMEPQVFRSEEEATRDFIRNRAKIAAKAGYSI